MYLVDIYLWNCSARHNSFLPCLGTVLRYIILHVWARVPTVTHTCVRRVIVFSFLEKQNTHKHTHSPLGPKIACVRNFGFVDMGSSHRRVTSASLSLLLSFP